MNRILSILIMAVWLVSGCSDGPAEPGDDAGTLTDAWKAFEAVDYVTAMRRFQELTVNAPRSGPAWLGLGWSQLRLREFNEALLKLDRALQEGATQSDGNAGRAFVFFERSPQDFTAAVGAANSALRFLNASWTFDHNPQVNWRDLRLILARSYFALTQYDDVNEQIAALGGNVVPATGDFLGAMAAEIGRLVGLYGGDSGGGHRPFEPPAGVVAVNFRVIDTSQSFTSASGLCMKGQFDVDASTRVVSEDSEWKAPWPLLFDDGPWTTGGHEPADAVAGDRTWSVAIFVAPLPGAQQFEYGLVSSAQVNADGFTGGMPGVADGGEVWIWPGAINGFFAVAPGGGADIDLPIVTLP